MGNYRNKERQSTSEKEDLLGPAPLSPFFSSSPSPRSFEELLFFSTPLIFKMKSGGAGGKVTDIRITVLGGGGVGKTAFTIQLVSHHFVEFYDPTIESSYRQQFMIDEEIAMLDILDTAGQEEYTALQSQWIRQGEGFVVLYSITDRSTFDEVEKFRTKILNVKDVPPDNAPPM